MWEGKTAISPTLLPILYACQTEGSNSLYTNRMINQPLKFAGTRLTLVSIHPYYMSRVTRPADGVHRYSLPTPGSGCVMYTTGTSQTAIRSRLSMMPITIGEDNH